MAESRSTVPAPVSERRVRAARGARRAFFVAVCALLVGAAAGVFGVRTEEARATGGGYELTVTYDRVSRGGLPSDLAIEIRRSGGFPSSVTVAVSSDYLAGFDENGVDPQPVGAVTTGDRLVQTFEAPTTGDTMAVTFDGRVEPGIQLKRLEGTVAVVENGRDVVSVSVRTFVMP